MKKYFLYSITGIVSGIINGLFGAGGGMIIVPTLEHFFEKETKIAHATAIAIILPLSATSAYFYLKNNLILFDVVLTTGSASVIGGLCGAIFLKKISGKLVRILFSISIIITGVRMLCF